MNELVAYPFSQISKLSTIEGDHAGVFVPLELIIDAGRLSFSSTSFRNPTDITLSELAIEAFFPVDANTAEILRNMIGKAS
ncbi:MULTISPECIES: hypothetical protein [unclassified Sinorhizobium]|uniref:hypothetical protein n=1 Tax=unclassified Sinorhizobium TaxID=2613772 RepID=UPI00352409E8